MCILRRIHGHVLVTSCGTGSAVTFNGLLPERGILCRWSALAAVGDLFVHYCILVWYVVLFLTSFWSLTGPEGALWCWIC
jgi:hypothetical protein